jgi:chorismate synthase
MVGSIKVEFVIDDEDASQASLRETALDVAAGVIARHNYPEVDLNDALQAWGEVDTIEVMAEMFRGNVALFDPTSVRIVSDEPEADD